MDEPADQSNATDYYKFCYEQDEEGSDDSSLIDENPPTAYSQQLSPRNALFPHLQSLSSNLRKRAESFNNHSHASLHSYNSQDIPNNEDGNKFDNVNDIFENTDIMSSGYFSSDFTANTLFTDAPSYEINNAYDDNIVNKPNDNALSLINNQESSAINQLPLIELLKRRSIELESYIKNKDYKLKKSDSPLMFLKRRTRSLTSKDSSYESLIDVKKNLLNDYNDSSNENTLEQPSPFVRTIFQFVESSFDDDIFPLEQFRTNSTHAFPVFSTSNMKTFSESKIFKTKSRYPVSSLERIINQDTHEPSYLCTGRRISDTSEFLISTIAYLDRIRKAKSKQMVKSKRCSRQHRWKSDPGLSNVKISNLVKVYNNLQTHCSDDFSTIEKYHANTISRDQSSSLLLHKRFELLSFCSDDGGITHFEEGYRSRSFTDFNNSTYGHKKQMNILGILKNKSSLSLNMSSVKKKSLRKKQEKTNRESLTFELQKLNDLNDDLNKFSESLLLKQEKLSTASSSDSPISLNEIDDDCFDFENKSDASNENIYSTIRKKDSENELLSENVCVDRIIEGKKDLGTQNGTNDTNDTMPLLSSGNEMSIIISTDNGTIEHMDRTQVTPSPTNDIKIKKSRTRVGSFGDKIKRKYNKKSTSDEIEYWVGEFKNSSSDSSIKNINPKSKELKLITNFKKQLGSFRKKDGKKTNTEIKRHAMLEKVGSRSNEEVNANKVPLMKQRSSSFRMKRDKEKREVQKKENTSRVEPVATCNIEVKKKWRISSPIQKSTQKMVSVLNNAKKDKSNSNHVNIASSVKEKSMKFIQYTSSPKLSPSCRLNNNKFIPHRRTSYSPPASKRSSKIEFLRKHFEQNKDLSSSDYSSICSSNSNSNILSSEEILCHKSYSANNSADSVDHTLTFKERRNMMRKSLSLDFLMEVPRGTKDECKSNDLVSNIDDNIVVTMPTNKDDKKSDFDETDKIIVDVPAHLIPSQIKRSSSPHHDISKNHVGTKNEIIEDSFIKAIVCNENNEPELSLIDHSNNNVVFNKTSTNAQEISLDNHSIASHDSLDASLESLVTSSQLNIDFSDVPSIPEPPLLKDDLPTHYASFSSSATHIFNDVSKMYPHNNNQPNKNIEKKSDTPPPVKPKPKMVFYGQPFHKQSNVAMVTPFLKDEVLNISEGDGKEVVLSSVKQSSLSASTGEQPVVRKPSVIWAVVKKMEVGLIIDRDYQGPDVIKIESFEVRRVNTYKDVEELAIDTFVKHLKLLDKQMLDLTKHDIEYLQMGMHKVPIGNEQFELTSVKIDDGFLPCQLCIEGKTSRSLAALAYDTLISKDYLEKYFGLVISQQFVVFYGPSGTSKSYLAVRLANVVSYRVSASKTPPLVYKNITPTLWENILGSIPSLIKQKESMILVLDGFAQTFISSGIDISEIVKLLETTSPPIYVICTISQNPNNPIAMEWQVNYRWVWLPNHEEPIDNILQRYLRRKFIQNGNPHLQKESFRIADWLNSVWKHINRIIEKFHSVECTIGPTMFYSCPADILSAEEWFVDLWNYSITPYFIQTVKQGIESRGKVLEWEDPLEWILKSYPWVSEKAKRIMKLRCIRLEDIGYRDVYNFESRSEQKRLMEFLHQLEMLMMDGGLGEIPNFSQLDYLESAI